MSHADLYRRAAETMRREEHPFFGHLAGAYELLADMAGSSVVEFLFGDYRPSDLDRRLAAAATAYLSHVRQLDDEPVLEDRSTP